MNIIEAIFEYRKYSTNKEIKAYLDKLGFVVDFKIINIVGTNGKGSIGHYLTENLSKKYKVGTFTSPHIFKPNERIKINNVNITDEDLEKEILDIMPTQLHFFAIMFISAMQYFKKNNCDVVILEAGIGGSFDPSNIYDGQIGVISSIGRDHMELFGDTLDDVAKDKLGIINKGMHFYSGTNLGKFNKYINNIQSKHFLIKNDFADYQDRNKALASAILKNEFNINPIFSEVLGRSTIQKNNNTLAILDVAHNQDGIMATIKHLKNINVKFQQVVLTISKRKEYKKLQEIFKDKDLFVFPLDESFISKKDLDAKEVKDLELFYSKQDKNTLYIGSFYSIGKILNEK